MAFIFVQALTLVNRQLLIMRQFQVAIACEYYVNDIIYIRSYRCSLFINNNTLSYMIAWYSIFCDYGMMVRNQYGKTCLLNFRASSYS